MLASELFAGDTLLEAIAAESPERISTVQNPQHPAVLKVQTALLDWRSDALPGFGADGSFGSECAAAVHRFKRDELRVPEGEIIDDVGPQTVRRLDQIRLAVEPPPPPPTRFVRQDAWVLGPEGAPFHPVLLAYARAVGELKKNAGPSPHLWWDHWTQVHGMTPDPNDGLRNQCQHNSWFFLPWHRIYIERFERVCRAIILAQADIGDDVKQTWALPYWDYDRDGTRTLPPVFRAPQLPDGSVNPLFEVSRRPGVNENTAPMSPTLTTAREWFWSSPFSQPSPVPSFGGPLTAFHHLNESGVSNRGALENTPHGTVHNAVGAGFKMGDFDQAAGDPIFWLHHCNIDRLWEIWRANAGAGADPTDPVLLDKTFDFLDETGQRPPQGFRAGDTLDPAQRDHDFADLSVPASAGPPPSRGLSVPINDPPQRVGSIDQPLGLLAGQPVSLSLALPDFDPLALADLQGPLRVFLLIEHLTAATPPASTFGIFLDAVGPVESTWIGNLPLFGLAESNRSDSDHGLDFSFDVTSAVQTLLDSGAWDATSLPLLLAPVDEGIEELAAAGLEIGSISLLVG